MRSHWAEKGVEIAIFAVIIVAGFGQAVLQLWNLLMPSIFGVRSITYWQALGLMGLSWILFGGLGMFRGRTGHPGHWRHRMAERLEQMPPEEREKFRQGLQRRCGRVATPADDPKA